MSKQAWMLRGLIVAGLVLGLALPVQAIPVTDSRLGCLTVGGVSGWRLPTTTQSDPSCSNQSVNGSFPDQGFGVNWTGSEMGHLFNVEAYPPLLLLVGRIDWGSDGPF